ncbi:hypothetical protein FI667_g15776, partial [Globisporangium splendens]
MFESLNPGSHTHFEQDDEGRFLRASFFPPASGRVLPFSQRVVGLDGAHAKNPRYNGTHLLMVGHDGNLENIALAVALIGKETKANNEWFFINCILGGIEFTHPLMSDRKKSLVEVCTRWQIHQIHSTLYILYTQLLDIQILSETESPRLMHSSERERGRKRMSLGNCGAGTLQG